MSVTPHEDRENDLLPRIALEDDSAAARALLLKIAQQIEASNMVYEDKLAQCEAAGRLLASQEEKARAILAACFDLREKLTRDRSSLKFYPTYLEQKKLDFRFVARRMKEELRKAENVVFVVDINESNPDGFIYQGRKYP